MSDTKYKKCIDDAILSFALGDEIEAKEALLNVLDSNPTSLDALRAVAEVLLALNEIDSSESFCRRALDLEPDDLTSMVTLARILVKKGDKEGAEDASAKARILGWKEELADGNV